LLRTRGMLEIGFTSWFACEAENRQDEGPEMPGVGIGVDRVGLLNASRCCSIRLPFYHPVRFLVTCSPWWPRTYISRLGRLTFVLLASPIWGRLCISPWGRLCHSLPTQASLPLPQRLRQSPSFSDIALSLGYSPLGVGSPPCRPGSSLFLVLFYCRLSTPPHYPHLVLPLVPPQHFFTHPHQLRILLQHSP